MTCGRAGRANSQRKARCRFEVEYQVLAAFQLCDCANARITSISSRTGNTRRHRYRNSSAGVRDHAMAGAARTHRLEFDTSVTHQPSARRRSHAGHCLRTAASASPGTQPGKYRAVSASGG